MCLQLLTTHYIEEARRAHKVGLMRDGKMLQQGTPKDIMKSTGSKTLEQAFLKICKSDEKQCDKQHKVKYNDEPNSSDSSSSSDDDSSDDDDDSDDGAMLATDAANEARGGDGASDASVGGSASDDVAAEKGSDKPESSPKRTPRANTDRSGKSDDEADSPRSSNASEKRKADVKGRASFSNISHDDFYEPLLGEDAATGSDGARPASPSTQGLKDKNAAAKHLQSPSNAGSSSSSDKSGFKNGKKKPHHSAHSLPMPAEHDKDNDDDSEKPRSSGAKPLVGWAKFISVLALPRWNQLWGLCWKNLTRMRKGVAAMIFQFIVPSVQVILFCVAIGKDPQHIHMGVVNLDTGSGPLLGASGGAGAEMHSFAQFLPLIPHPTMPTWNDGSGRGGIGTADGSLRLSSLSAAAATAPPRPRSSMLQQMVRKLGLGAAPSPSNIPSNFLSADFLANLDDHFITRSYASSEEALAGVRTNAVWGWVRIPQNYTLNTLRRLNQTVLDPLAKLPEDLIANSTLTYTLDLSNEQMSVFLLKSISTAYTALMDKHAPDLQKQSPLQMEPPVYGDADASFTDFVAPGIIITIAFSGSIGLTAITFVLDKKTGNLGQLTSYTARFALACFCSHSASSHAHGCFGCVLSCLLDRIWSSGVRASEIMLAQVLTQLIIFVIQIGLLLIFGLLVFKLPLEGSGITMAKRKQSMRATREFAAR